MNKSTASTHALTPTRTIENVSTLFILFLLIFLIFARTGESLHSQMTQMATSIWEDYFSLRSDIETPTCEIDFDIESRLQELEAAASSAEDEFDLGMADEFDRAAARISLEAQKEQCSKKRSLAKLQQEKITPGLKIFRAAEHSLTAASNFATSQQKLMLVMLLFAAAFVATLKRHHIAFRPMVNKLDFQISLPAQFIANACLTLSAFSFRGTALGSGVDSAHPEVINGLVIGSSVLTLLSLQQLFNIPKDAPNGGTVGRALSSIPLYTIIMLVFAAIIFIGRGHLPGLAIYFTAFFEHAGTFLDVALYLWTGMLLKQTQIGERVFSLLTPWRLPPEILAFAAIVIMAVPTAYTGASSIIILAMGTVVYQELRKVGTRRQLALAATAMSGSSGIVLQPCLIVVLIAILNKEVTTDQLFGWGVKVFMLTGLVFLIYALVVKKDPFKVASAKEALGPMFANFKPIVPYILVFIAIMVAYALLLDAYLDEFSAPVMLPVIITALVIFERAFSKAKPLYDDPDREPTVYRALTRSMSDSSIHIGGLLMMMATFAILIGLGGTGIEPTFLYELDSTFAIMGVLIVMLVVIGMVTESMAAVGLVSFTIAPVAYAQGIDPIHFWMTCLVALELGYLSPPVALSHIFTRQVVGEDEAVAASLEGDNFYYRNEKILLPIMVMATTLVLVAFVPLMVGY